MFHRRSREINSKSRFHDHQSLEVVILPAPSSSVAPEILKLGHNKENSSHTSEIFIILSDNERLGARETK